MFQTELWNWNDFRSPNCGMSETITARARMPVSSCAECPGGTGIGQTNRVTTCGCPSADRALARKGRALQFGWRRRSCSHWAV